MTQTIFLNGLEQYAMVPKLVSVNNSTGDQNPIIGLANGDNLKSIIQNVAVSVLEYPFAEWKFIESPVITWDDNTGQWKLTIPAKYINKYGTTWITITGQTDDSTVTIIPTSLQVEVSPVLGTQVPDSQFDFPLEFLISQRHIFTAVIDGKSADYNIEYTQNDVDSIGAILYRNGTPLDLTGCTVQFVMKDVETGEHRYPINCILGGTVEDYYFPAIKGGVTIPFTAKETAMSGLFKGKFVISGTWGVAHAPSGDNYLNIMIWEDV